jgi:plastocyanin
MEEPMPAVAFNGRGRPIVALVISVVALGIAAGVAIAASATISGFAYHPNPITVTVGGSVTWTNNDPVGHTVSADDGSFTSGTLANGATYNHTFTTVGTVAYHCNIHPSMHGMVQVQAAPQPTPRPTPTPRRSPRPTARITPPPADMSSPSTHGGTSSVGVMVAALAGIATVALRTRPGRRRP